MENWTMEHIGEARMVMANKKIKLDEIYWSGEWRNSPEDRKFVEYVCLKKFAALRIRPDRYKTDDDKISCIIRKLWNHYQYVEIVKDVLNSSLQGVTVILNPDIGFLCEHPDDKPDLLYISPEENRTLTIEVKQNDAIIVKDGYLLIPSRVDTHHADFVAAIVDYKLYLAAKDDDYQIGYEFDYLKIMQNNIIKQRYLESNQLRQALCRRDELH